MDIKDKLWSVSMRAAVLEDVERLCPLLTESFLSSYE